MYFRNKRWLASAGLLVVLAFGVVLAWPAWKGEKADTLHAVRILCSKEPGEAEMWKALGLQGGQQCRIRVRYSGTKDCEAYVKFQRRAGEWIQIDPAQESYEDVGAEDAVSAQAHCCLRESMQPTGECVFMIKGVECGFPDSPHRFTTRPESQQFPRSERLRCGAGEHRIWPLFGDPPEPAHVSVRWRGTANCEAVVRRGDQPEGEKAGDDWVFRTFVNATDLRFKCNALPGMTPAPDESCRFEITQWEIWTPN